MRPPRYLRTSILTQLNTSRMTVLTSFLSKLELGLTIIHTWATCQAKVLPRQVLLMDLIPFILLLLSLAPEKVRRLTKDFKLSISINLLPAHLVDLLQMHRLIDKVTERSISTSHKKSKLTAQMVSCRCRNPRSCLKDHLIQTEMK